MSNRLPILGLLVVLALLTLPFLPFFYNHYVFPLGRLHNSLNPGDSYETVYPQFADYEAAYAGDGENLQFSKGIRATDFYHAEIEPSEFLFLYHVNTFDDVQLGVLFDHDRKVSQIYFVGD